MRDFYKVHLSRKGVFVPMIASALLLLLMSGVTFPQPSSRDHDYQTTQGAGWPLTFRCICPVQVVPGYWVTYDSYYVYPFLGDFALWFAVLMLVELGVDYHRGRIPSML